MRRLGFTRRTLFLAPAIGVLAAVLGARAIVGEAVWSPGPLTPGHEILAGDCARCHTTSFPSKEESMTGACLTCHARTIGHDPLTGTALHHGGHELSCTDCHGQHQPSTGGESAACTRCHSDPTVSRKLASKMSAFADDHPEFRLIAEAKPDPGTITFDHQLHVAGAAEIPCNECHQPRMVGAREEGRMASIEYEAHCERCHAIAPDGKVPHATPEVVRAFLVAHGKSDAELYEKAGQGCRKCHQVSAGDPPVVAPSNIPNAYFARARFDHPRHSAVLCTTCHAGVGDSRRASDVLLPGVDQCKTCHAPHRGASFECNECHGYHVNPTEAPRPSTPPSLVMDGERATRFALKDAKPPLPLPAFLALPERVWNLPDVRPGTERFQKELFDRYGLFPADYANDGLPLGLMRTTHPDYWSDEPGVMITCEYCHSSSLFGRVLVGAPNPFSSLRALFEDMAIATGTPDHLKALFDQNPEKNSMVNSADQLGYYGLLVRNDDLSIRLSFALRVQMGFADYAKPDFDAIAYVKTPPWWTFAKKRTGAAGYYYDGGNAKNANFAAYTYLSAFIALDGSDIRAQLAEWKRSGPAFLSTLEAPKYPFAIDRAAAGRGREIYTEKCERCHGEEDRYPGLITPLDDVKTDPKRAHMPASFQREAKRVLKETYSIASNGYVAMPLDGIWARAPYLHNGSVPTLLHLLDPKRRPKVWALIADPNRPEDFDQVEVGWKFEAPPSPGRTRIHDPSKSTGLENSGHTYGEELDDRQRADLIEHLKTL